MLLQLGWIETLYNYVGLRVVCVWDLVCKEFGKRVHVDQIFTDISCFCDGHLSWHQGDIFTMHCCKLGIHAWQHGSTSKHTQQHQYYRWPSGHPVGVDIVFDCFHL